MDSGWLFGVANVVLRQHYKCCWCIRVPVLDCCIDLSAVKRWIRGMQKVTTAHACTIITYCMYLYSACCTASIELLHEDCTGATALASSSLGRGRVRGRHKLQFSPLIVCIVFLRICAPVWVTPVVATSDPTCHGCFGDLGRVFIERKEQLDRPLCLVGSDSLSQERDRPQSVCGGCVSFAAFLRWIGRVRWVRWVRWLPALGPGMAVDHSITGMRWKIPSRFCLAELATCSNKALGASGTFFNPLAHGPQLSCQSVGRGHVDPQSVGRVGAGEGDAIHDELLRLIVNRDIADGRRSRRPLARFEGRPHNVLYAADEVDLLWSHRSWRRVQRGRRR
jgi:hypothetical protein